MEDKDEKKTIATMDYIRNLQEQIDELAAKIKQIDKLKSEMERLRSRTLIRG